MVVKSHICSYYELLMVMMKVAQVPRAYGSFRAFICLLPKP